VGNRVLIIDDDEKLRKLVHEYLESYGFQVITLPDGSLAMKTIEAELQEFSPELAARERWLVFNKIDMLPAAERESHCAELAKRLVWGGPVFAISALAQEGTRELCEAVMTYLEQQAAEESDLAQATADTEAVSE